MNKSEYKQFSSRLRAAWSNCRGRSGRFTAIARRIMRRMGLDMNSLDLDRVDIVDGGTYYPGSLEFKRRGEILDRQEGRQWCGAYNAVRTMQYAADYLNGWRAVDIEEYLPEHEIEVIEAVSI